MKKDTPNLVTIAGLTVATLFFWVIFSIYQAFLEDADVVIEDAVLADIDPTLDTTSLNSLDTRVAIEEPDLSSLVSSVESSIGVVVENEEGFEIQTSSPSATTPEESDEFTDDTSTSL